MKEKREELIWFSKIGKERRRNQEQHLKVITNIGKDWWIGHLKIMVGLNDCLNKKHLKLGICYQDYDKSKYTVNFAYAVFNNFLDKYFLEACFGTNATFHRKRFNHNKFSIGLRRLMQECRQ